VPQVSGNVFFRESYDRRLPVRGRTRLHGKRIVFRASGPWAGSDELAMVPQVPRIVLRRKLPGRLPCGSNTRHRGKRGLQPAERAGAESSSELAVVPQVPGNVLCRQRDQHRILSCPWRTRLLGKRRLRYLEMAGGTRSAVQPADHAVMLFLRLAALARPGTS
jgi:hypothetical protein